MNGKQMKNDNETVIFDFDEYILENLATCETEKSAATSVDELKDFAFTDEQGETQPSFFQYCIAEELRNNERLFFL